MQHKNAGFTLIEILVALLIFAIIGVLSALSLHSIIRTHEKLKKTDQQLLQLQITMTLMRRDISQMINRKIRDVDNDQESAFLAPNNNEIIFTRSGLFNPMNNNTQSNMQRVGYVLRGNNLVRLTWGVLDQAPSSSPESQILLSNVESLTWQMITDDGSKTSTWPPTYTSSQASNQSPLPKVVLMVMRVKNEGVIQGVFPVPARGANANMQQ